MPRLMRCIFCGLLQDEPSGVKVCPRCGGELVFETPPETPSYIEAQLELDQINAPAGKIVDRHLVLTLHTPPEVPDAYAAPTTSGREPMAFAAVLDVSGSMRGSKIASAIQAVEQAILRLHDGDTFALITFANNVETPLPPTRVDAALRKNAQQILDDVRAGGKTALCGGLDAGIAALQSSSQETNLVLLLSDGQANVGETDLEEVGMHAYQGREQSITTSTLGVGNDYNEALMVEIATQGGGRFYHVQHARQIVPYVAGELGEMSALAAKDTVLHLTLPHGTTLQPFSTTYTTRSESSIALGDIPVDSELEIVLRLLLPPQAAGARLPIEGRLTYHTPGGDEIDMPLNTVTLRFVEEMAYQRTEGVVVPVVERVLEQMKARSVLGAARAAAAKGQAAAQQQTRLNLSEIRDYASLLGEERADDMVEAQERDLQAMAAAPAMAKSIVDKAYRRQRGTKSFDEKK